MKLKPNPEFLEASAEHRKKWHDALVSTELKQGSGWLFDGDGYCCLAIGHMAFGGQRRFLNPDSYSTPPRGGVFAKTFGSFNPAIAIYSDGRKGEEIASECNDYLRLSFAAIAKLVYPEAYGEVEIEV